MTSSLAETWTPRLRELFPVDLPESRPLYLLGSQDCPDGFGDLARAGCSAYTAPALSRQLESHFRDRDAWRGDGFVIVFDEGVMTRLDNGGQLGLLIHEVAHCCDDADQIPSFRRPVWTAAVIDTARPTDGLVERMNRVADPWEQHGLRHIRAALHLHHRTITAGARVDLESLTVAGRRYGLSCAEAYAAALADEVRDRIGDSVVTILESPEPDVMRNLFAADIERHYVEQFRREVCRQLEGGATVKQALANRR